MEVGVDPGLIEAIVEPVPQPHRAALVDNLGRDDERRRRVGAADAGLTPALDVEARRDELVTRGVHQRGVGIRAFPRGNFRRVHRRFQKRNVEPPLLLHARGLRVEVVARDDVQALGRDDGLEHR